MKRRKRAGVQIYYKDNFSTQYLGHVLRVLPELPAESVQCIVTSPPYWGLHDYGLEPQVWDADPECEHEWGDWQEKHDTREEITAGKSRTTDRFYGEESRRFDGNHQKHTAGQFCSSCNAWRGSLGLEPTPELYIKHLTDIFREVRRVLRKDGTVWLNIGDSYASGKGSCFNPGGGANSLEGHAKLKEAKAYKLNRPNISDLEGMGLKPKDLCMIPARVALALQADGWWLRSDIIWAKPNPMPESVKDRPTTAHEHVFLLTKSGKYFYDQDAVREKNSQGSIERFGLTEGIGQTKKWNTSQNKRDGRTDGTKGTEGFRNHIPLGRNLRSVWTIATEPTPEAHFATFPQKLVEPCILAGCPVGGVVLDPFSGSGKVGLVAKRLGRRAVLIDLKREYCAIFVKKTANGEP